jgi:hypothetical protein
MKYAAWFFALLSISAFAQNLPDDNAAAGALQKRFGSIKLFKAPGADGSRPTPKFVIAPPAMAQVIKPPICAMPLLNAMPQAKFDDRMPIAKPRTPPEGSQREAVLPAPACDEAFLRNR